MTQSQVQPWLAPGWLRDECLRARAEVANWPEEKRRIHAGQLAGPHWPGATTQEAPPHDG